MMMQDPWADMATIPVGGLRLPRIAMGMHALKVLRCTMPNNNKAAFICEFEVVQSNNVQHAPGSQCSVYIASQYADSLKAKTKALVAAIYGYSPTDANAMTAFGPFTTEIVRRALSAENFLEGRRVGCEGIPDKKRDPNTGEPYVNYAWCAIDPPGVLPLPPPPAYAPQPPPQAGPPQYYQPPAQPPPRFVTPPDAPPGWTVHPQTGQWIPPR